MGSERTFLESPPLNLPPASKLQIKATKRVPTKTVSEHLHHQDFHIQITMSPHTFAFVSQLKQQFFFYNVLRQTIA